MLNLVDSSTNVAARLDKVNVVVAVIVLFEFVRLQSSRQSLSGRQATKHLIRIDVRGGRLSIFTVGGLGGLRRHGQ